MSHRQIRNRMGALALGAVLLALGGAHRRAHGDDDCANPGTDGPFSGGGIVNTYYPPNANGSIDPAATLLALGTPTGAVATLRFGALLLVIQMQDAQINTSDDNRYGDGVQEIAPTPDQGSGTLTLNSTGLYEYIIVDDGVTLFGTAVPDLTAVPFRGTGPNGKLKNTYNNFAATPAANPLRGQQRFQIVRVPQYTTVTLNNLLTALPWDGKTGGILAIDVAGDLVLNNATVNLTGLGFRGGFGEKISSGSGANTAYRVLTTVSAFGNKGEGIAGTPKNIAPGLVNPEGEGYPHGSRARGAPANAGGGGNPDVPATNTDSSGGGGGGNGGRGGQGGNTGNSNLVIGGFGGAPFVLDGTTTPAWTAGRVIMGGGGGSGTKNNTAPGAADGGAGGGILMVRAKRFFRGAGGTQSATFTANGAAGADGNNNGGGGGGAGGTVILSAITGDLTGVTINARGGDGGPAGTGVNKYGPGGGGGGGVILISGPGAVTHTEPGINGLTVGEGHGASGGIVGSPTPGTVGNPLITPGDIPGGHSGAECSTYEAVNDLYAANVNPATLTVAAPGVRANDELPNGFTYTAVKDSDPLVSQGTLTAFNADGSFTFAPAAGFIGIATFTYHMNNGTPSPGGDSNIATVSINVGGNVPPTATDDSYPATEDVDLNVTAPGVLANDVDLNGDNLTAVLDTTTSNGTLTLHPDGSFEYAPNPDFHGTDTFTYHANDGTANSSIVTVTITVASVNDAPVAVGDGPYVTLVDTPITVTVGSGVLINDSDVDLDTLTAVLNLNVANGVLGLNPDGSFTYTPNPLYVGADSFTYHANDGAADSTIVIVTINVQATNSSPVAVADAYTTTERRTLVVPVGTGVLANDTDADGNPIQAILDSSTANGSLSLGLNGSFSYTPNPGFIGIDTFTYHASDGIASSNIVTVTITVFRAGPFDAGYCGSTGVDLLFPLVLLLIYRRIRDARVRRSLRSTT